MSRRYRPFDPFDRGTGGPFDARREIRIPQVPRRFWGGVALFALAVLVFVLASPIVSFITELQWYDALGLRDVYTTRLGLQWSIGLASLLLAFAYLAVNVFIALRVRAGPGLRAVGIRRSVLRSTAGWVSLATAAVIAIILAAGASSQWQALALFMHSSPTGTADPVLGQDISFYLLTLPFLHAATNWSLGLDFMAVLLIGAIYSWRGDSFDFRPTPPAPPDPSRVGRPGPPARKGSGSGRRHGRELAQNPLLSLPRRISTLPPRGAPRSLTRSEQGKLTRLRSFSQVTSPHEQLAPTWHGRCMETARRRLHPKAAATAGQAGWLPS